MNDMVFKPRAGKSMKTERHILGRHSRWTRKRQCGFRKWWSRQFVYIWRFLRFM